MPIGLDKDKIACPEPRVLDEDKVDALNQEWYPPAAEMLVTVCFDGKVENKRLGPSAKGPNSKYYFRSAYGTQNAVTRGPINKSMTGGSHNLFVLVCFTIFECASSTPFQEAMLGQRKLRREQTNQAERCQRLGQCQTKSRYARDHVLQT